jgi:DNA polymerase III delta prime subunit
VTQLMAFHPESAKPEFFEAVDHSSKTFDAQNAPPNHLVEWQRVELLCHCLMNAKEGPSDALLKDLQQFQNAVLEWRKGNFWQKLELPNEPLVLDILACVLAPLILPRVGWLYQSLQNSNQPAPSEALIISLLALPDVLLEQARHALNQLEQRGLVKRDNPDPFSPLMADQRSLARLMGWSLEDFAPPGAFPVKRRAQWEDLVMPAAQKNLLREYLYWIQHKHQVVNDWGGQTVGGPVALFAGPSGTGKTLAASVIASELGWPLFRVDLAALVSKYVGETEKNIGRLFDATHGRQMILQFDEVDALMGKRGELREARDRYANMEVSYLLSRIEDHDGPCVLSTNLRSQIDKAFCRRFQMVVEFERPDVEQRVALWQKLLPPRAPLAANVDLPLVATAVTLSGGQIRNAALHAAYIAASQHTAIDMACIALAVHRELAKEQSRVAANQLGALAAFVPLAEFG